MSETLGVNSMISHYRIVSKIGAGGMGEVYLAQDTKLERQIALKVLLDEVAGDEDRVKRFVQEAKAASALNHPNILTVYEIGEFDGSRYIATELIKGVTLRDRLGSEPMTLREVLDVAVQVAAALNAAHNAGIVHRDIKPENIMLRDDGIVKVLDFGLAKLVATRTGSADSEDATRAQVNTRPGMVMGTVLYMSPEQARGKETDARCDVWSLGIVMYEMLARATPFVGETANDSIAAILTKEPPPLDDATPSELRRIVRKSLQKQTDERYQTVKDLLLDVKNLKRELEFSEELERSHVPQSTGSSNVGTAQMSENATAVSSGVISTQTSTPQQLSSAEYLVSEIRGHKKSVTALLVILLVALFGGGYWFLGGRGSAKQIESIAVMPFVNESGNADVEYLSDGMTETLISSLSQLPNLNVKGRSSVFRYKGKDVDTKTLGKELGVQAVLYGRMIQRGDQLTVSLELLDAVTENVIWSGKYDRKQADVVSLQSEIARDVSNKLKTKLSGADVAKVEKGYTANPEAYRLYLQGRFYWNKRTEADLTKSIEYFNQAIAIDPSYALSYAGLADAYGVMPSYAADPRPDETYPKARAAVQKALEIDPNLAEPHATLGYILHEYDWNHGEAEKEFKRAIELDPNYPSAHQWYGEYLMDMGRSDEAIAELKRALELNPLSAVIYNSLGNAYRRDHPYDEAIAQYQKAIEIDPKFLVAYSNLYGTYISKGMYEQAIEVVRKRRLMHGDPPEQVEKETAEIIEAYRKSGERGFWQLVLKKTETSARDNNREPNPLDIARIQLQLGNKEQAFDSLEKAFASGKRDIGLLRLKSNATFDPLRSDPRFKEMLRKVGLPE